MAATTRKKSPKKSRSGPRVRVRMYRHGLGDCLLVTLAKKNGEPFYLMIDCGLIQNAGRQAEDRLGAAIRNIIEDTGGKVDVLVATHEHWDHLSGFVQFPELFAGSGVEPEEPTGKKSPQLSVGQVWLAWTENRRDALATKIREERAAAITGLERAKDALAASGDRSLAAMGASIGGLLEFFGARRTTAQALETVRKLGAERPRYCRPDGEPWTHRELPGVRIYTLGPPRDEKLLKKRMAKNEVYHLYGATESSFFGVLGARSAGGEAEAMEPFHPFDETHRLSLDAMRAAATSEPGDEQSPLSEFFRRHYFGHDPAATFPDQSWRRIDHDWLGSAQDLALHLDSATNNTSLVLAIELADTGQVLLFAADAQVGNWLSWQDLAWTLDDETEVTGPDLLSRAVFYKVGHHGSHNATLKEKGLEQMVSDDLVAFIPVDSEMAKKYGWGQMPLPGLIRALDKQSNRRVVRSDRDRKPDPKWLAVHDLYYEYILE